MHSILLSNPAILSSREPGTSVSFDVIVNDALQPPASVAGTIAVDFNGETATKVIAVTFDETIQPVTTVSFEGTNLEATIGTPVMAISPVGKWTVPVTITVV